MNFNKIWKKEPRESKETKVSKDARESQSSKASKDLKSPKDSQSAACAIPDIETLELLGSRMNDSYDKGKVFVLLAHYSQAIIFGLLLGAINIRQGFRTAGSIEMGFGICVAALLSVYFFTRSQKFLNVAVFVYSMTFNTLQLVTGGNNGFSLFWVLVGIPCLFYFLDYKWALAVNYGRFMLIAAFLWIPSLSRLIYPYEQVTRVRYPIVFLMLTAFCHFIQVQYRISRDKQDENMKLAIAYGKQALAAQEKAEMAQKEAVYANKAKSQFLSNMSHDIRTPMNAIIGYTGIASAHIDDPMVVKDSLGKINVASEHLQGLINDVLDMSRIESGRESIHLSQTSVPEMVRGVLPMIQAQVNRKHMDLYVDTIDLRNEKVYADTQKIRQILINILGNAVKFTGEGGNIGIRVQETPCRKKGFASYVIRVKDNGIGMSEEFQQHLFEAFAQEHTNEESGLEGTGLGMSITKSLVELMGGTIKVNSQEGRGTEFIISLDLKLQEDAKLDTRIEQLRGFRALVVDDDFQTCDSITHMLTEVGMRSDWTTSARDAVLRTKKAVSDNDPFFAYIIDWLMPEMNGLELARKIRKIVGEDVPIIILTAYAWGDIAEEAKEAGVTTLCTKPLFASDLTSVFLDNINVDGMMTLNPRIKTTQPEKSFMGQRVLLVEDNVLNREIATVQLEGLGLQVEERKNGKAAVERLNEVEDGYYDFVLMDIRMPVMNGLEATKAIRASEREYLKKVPILALTANAFDEDAEACKEAGMNEHISKPVKPEVLKALLEKY